MAETTYTSVVWTAGDFITEAKLDSMVANDRAVDSMYEGTEFTERADPSTPAGNKIHLYAKDKGGVPTFYAINDAGTIYELSEGRPTFERAVGGTLFLGTSVPPIMGVHRTLTIVKAYAYVKTAPTDADLIVDINKNGSTIWSTQANRLTIADGNLSGTQTSFNTVTLAEGDTLTIDIDQVGSTIAGADLLIQLRCR